MKRHVGTTRRTQRVVFAVLALLPLLAGIALATPGVGIISAPVHARGTNAGLLNVHSKAGVKLKTKSSVDFVTQQITIAPGGTTGWHSHPGPVLVTVKSGELTLVYADDESCQGRTYRAGESFVDRGDEIVHTALNRGSTNLELWGTYLVPGAPGTPMRIDAPSPGTCPF
jgi:mannose-6-phosphate isomerase-like protein (cupin superfamily)